MVRHLHHCSLYKVYRRRTDDLNTGDGVQMIDSLIGWSAAQERKAMTPNQLKEKVLRIIIVGNLSFSHAENPEFVELLNDAYPDCPAPTRKTIVDYLHSKATVTKGELRAQLATLDSKVSLALDAWTTRTNLAFLGIIPVPIRIMVVVVVGGVWEL